MPDAILNEIYCLIPITNFKCKNIVLYFGHYISEFLSSEFPGLRENFEITFNVTIMFSMSLFSNVFCECFDFFLLVSFASITAPKTIKGQ